jgi:hypothetical protein
MAKFKDFGVGGTLEEKEPISFKLYDEEFFCVNHIQGKVLLDLIAKSNSEDSAVSAQIVLTDESNARFDQLVLDKNRVVSVETLSEIVGWLMGQYSDRPESQPEDSSAGQ